MVKAILLDIDGTLYPVEPCHEAGLKSAHRMGMNAIAEWTRFETFNRDYQTARTELHGRIKGTAASHCRLIYFKLMLERYQQEVSLGTLKRLHSNYWAGYFSKMELFPECRRTIDFLRAQSMRLVWLTNFTTDRQIEKLVTLGLDKMGVLLTSEEVGKDKPDPALLNLALSLLKLKPEECVMVGDDWNMDVVPASRLGIQAFYLSSIPKADAVNFAQVIQYSNWLSIREHLQKLVS